MMNAWIRSTRECCDPAKGPEKPHWSKVIKFTEQLIQRSTGIWHDCYGDYQVSIGNAVLSMKIAKWNRCRILAADYVRELTPLHQYTSHNEQGSEYLVSIGSFETHNLAKNIGLESEARLVTVPVPIANDSFCTNRCSSMPGEPSHECIFPKYTVVDTAILQKFPPSSNLLGLGEFIGLYTSILDYFESRGISPPSSLLAFIVRLFHDIYKEYRSDYEAFLKKTAISLVFKCLIMRTNRDHQIGSGIDHLIAYVLEKNLQIPHGKAVYWGTCLSLVLFPRWDSFGLDWRTLVARGVNIGVISLEEMYQIGKLDIPSLIESAVKVRPGRTTVLASALEQKAEFLNDSFRIFKQFS